MTEPILKPKWEVEQDTESVHWEIRDPDGWFDASVRESGCIDLRRYHNVPCTERTDGEHPQLIDYLHLCNLDDFIERIQQLKIVAKMRYGDHWK